MATIIDAPGGVSYLKALAYGGDFPAGGTVVEVAFLDGALAIRSESGYQRRIEYAAIRVELGGFNHTQLHFLWQELGTPMSITLDKTVVSAVMANSVSASLRQLLEPVGRDLARRGRKRVWNIALVAALVLAPLLLVFAFLWHSDRLAEWVVSGVTIEAEEELGDLLFEQTKPRLKLLVDDEFEKVVAEIGERLARGESYNFTWHVADDPAVNAFAMPGGHVVVFTGLLRAADSAEELAGVLAHEIQHVIQRHSLKAMVKNLGLQAVVGMATGDLSGSVVVELATQMGSLKFSRDAEYEADIKGVEVLRRAAIDPKGMIRFFEKLEQKESGQIALLSTHPASSDRITRLQEYLTLNPVTLIHPLDYDWEKLKN